MAIYFAGLHEEHDPDDLRQIKQVTGFPLHDKLTVIAYANGRTSHYALGALTLYLARTYQGLVDLGGALDDSAFTVRGQCPQDAGVQQIIEMYRAYFEGHPGQLWEVPYEVWDQSTWFSHYCDAQFMAWWLNHPQFRMVK